MSDIIEILDESSILELMFLDVNQGVSKTWGEILKSSHLYNVFSQMIFPLNLKLKHFFCFFDVTMKLILYFMKVLF